MLRKDEIFPCARPPGAAQSVIYVGAKDRPPDGIHGSTNASEEFQ